MKRFFWVLSSVVASALACGPPVPGSLTPRDRDLLTYDEIVSSAHDGADLYETLLSLRPHFLQAPLGVQRGSAPPGTAVYVDSRRSGGLETLHNIIAGNVEEVRYLSPTQSQNELGPTASLGALMIKLRHRTDRGRTDTTFDVTPRRS
jgi:hypothetical protein